MFLGGQRNPGEVCWITFSEEIYYSDPIWLLEDVLPITRAETESIVAEAREEEGVEDDAAA